MPKASDPSMCEPVSCSTISNANTPTPTSRPPTTPVASSDGSPRSSRLTPSSTDRWNADARSRDDGPVPELLVQHNGRVFEGLGDISAPTLVVVGSEDKLFLPAAEVMVKRMPDARKVVLDGAGHMANVDAPNEFNAAVSEFLEGM